MSGNIKLIAKNTLFLYIRMFVVMLITLYMSRIVLRELGVDDYGIYNLVGGIGSFFVFLKTALTNATSRYLTFAIGKNDSDYLNRVYSMAINSHLILSFSLLLIMEFVGVWFIDSYLHISPDRLAAAHVVYHFSLFVFCLSIIQNPFNSNIIAHEKMNFYAIISIIEACLKLLLVYSLVMINGDKLIVYSLLMAIVSIIVFLLYYFYCKTSFRNIKYKKIWDKDLVSQFASYSGWSLIVNVTDVTVTQSMSILFNLFVGLAANAALGIMNQVNAAICMLVGNMCQAFNPQIIKSYAEGDMSYFKSLMSYASKISILLFLCAAIPVFVNIDYILDIWLVDYPDILPRFIRISLLYYLFDTSETSLLFGIHAVGKIRYHQIAMSIIKVIAIPLMYLALKAFKSPELALLLWSLLNLICIVVRPFCLRRITEFDTNTFFKKVLMRGFAIVVIVLPLGWLSAYLCGFGFVGLLTSTVIILFSIILLSFSLMLNNEERMKCIVFIKSKLQK